MIGSVRCQGILESAIKITNEPPTGMFANLHKALDNFNQVRTGRLATTGVVASETPPAELQ